MKTTPHGWTIIDADAGVLSFTYNFAGEGTSNTFTAKLPSGGLVVVSPASKISQEQFDDLAAYGEVEAVVANNGFHHLGLARWHELAPKARLFAAPGAVARIAKRSKTAPTLEPLSALEPLLGDDVAVVEVPTSKAGETWVRVKLAKGYAWYASDLLANLDRLPSNFFVRMLFKLTKSGPGYRVFNLAVKLIVKDKKAGLRAMLDDVREHPPTVMVPAHGGIVTGKAVAADTEALLSAAVG
ncbi:MAG: hypothetical protein KDK70_17100 [Myxococcales bacterium]|nr:hypothetical protein [Myxococcales bacterium]